MKELERSGNLQIRASRRAQRGRPFPPLPTHAVHSPSGRISVAQFFQDETRKCLIMKPFEESSLCSYMASKVDPRRAPYAGLSARVNRKLKIHPRSGESMARSKNLHYVQTTVNLEAPFPVDVNENWAEGTIQTDYILSNQLGRTIRNGNQFRLVGIGAQLRGYTGAHDQDVGFGATATIYAVPVTRHSVKAWQNMYHLWRKQKQLAASQVGRGVRYDDFECGWDSSNFLPSGRTSKVRIRGMEDVGQEYVTLIGNSVDNQYVSIQDTYDSMNPQAEVSRNPFGTLVKDPKWTYKFPATFELSSQATFSNTVDVASTPDTFAGGIAMGGINWLPSDNHISHLTGTLYYFIKGTTPTHAIADQDKLKMVITLVYEGWSPLASSPKKLKKGKSSKK